MIKDKYWTHLGYLQKSIGVGLVISVIFISAYTIVAIVQIANDHGMLSCEGNYYCIISFTLMAILFSLPKVVLIILISTIIGLIINKYKQKNAK